MDDMVHSPILAEPEISAAARPLIVDLDGSLVRTDTSLECIVALAFDASDHDVHSGR